jgi:hypothetical protein
MAGALRLAARRNTVCFFKGTVAALVFVLALLKPLWNGPACGRAAAAAAAKPAGALLSPEELAFSHMAQASMADCMGYPCDESDACAGSAALPCCTALLAALVADVAALFEQNKFLYMAVLGTLLGAVRNASIVPNGNSMDVDLALEQAAFQTLLADSAAGGVLRLALHRAGLAASKVHPGVGRVCFSRHVRHPSLAGVPEVALPEGVSYTDSFRYLDLYELRPKAPLPRRRPRPGEAEAEDEEPQVFVIGVDSWGEYARATLFPVQHVAVEGRLRLPVPAASTALLQEWYGADWRVVKRSKHGGPNDAVPSA